jgi:hypothetical protein
MFGHVFHDRDFLYVGAICGLLLHLLIIGFERGTWEGLLRREPILTGRPLFHLRDKLATFQKVWFVGHSLGGAFAVLGFALYRSWCRKIGCNDNGSVITFGAPRVGFQTFHTNFETQHRDRFWNVVVAGDPVPETPPSNRRHLQKSKIWFRSFTGMVIFALYFPWQIYAWLWGQEPAGEWTQSIVISRTNAAFDTNLHDIRRSYQSLFETQSDDPIYQHNQMC